MEATDLQYGSLAKTLDHYLEKGCLRLTIFETAAGSMLRPLGAAAREG